MSETPDVRAEGLDENNRAWVRLGLAKSFSPARAVRRRTGPDSPATAIRGTGHHAVHRRDVHGAGCRGVRAFRRAAM
jgi:hypothetical protein